MAFGPKALRQAQKANEGRSMIDRLMTGAAERFSLLVGGVGHDRYSSFSEAQKEASWLRLNGAKDVRIQRIKV